MTIDYFGFAYAVLIVVGGVIGFVKAGSSQSLIWGLIFGAILAFGAYRLSLNSGEVYISLIASVALMILMAVRFYITRSFMPAGLVVIISLLMIIKLGYQGISHYKTHDDTML